MPMTPLLFAWQTFYFVLATAAATLAGLLFVGLTFSAGMAIKGDVFRLIRIWAEPMLLDFIQVLGLGAIAEMPDLTPVGLAWTLSVLWVWRTWRLWEVVVHFRSMGKDSDLEWDDWLYLAVLPAVMLGILGASTVGFFQAQSWAPLALAVNCLGTLLMGIYNTWTQWVWMAAERSKGKKKSWNRRMAKAR
jgi:hypothetical protein